MPYTLTLKTRSSGVRQTDYVARWAGDEFVVLLENIAPEAVELLKRADVAMYNAKHAGKAQVRMAGTPA